MECSVRHFERIAGPDRERPGVRERGAHRIAVGVHRQVRVDIDGAAVVVRGRGHVVLERGWRSDGNRALIIQRRIELPYATRPRHHVDGRPGRVRQRAACHRQRGGSGPIDRIQIDAAVVREAVGEARVAVVIAAVVRLESDVGSGDSRERAVHIAVAPHQEQRFIPEGERRCDRAVGEIHDSAIRHLAGTCDNPVDQLELAVGVHRSRAIQRQRVARHDKRLRSAGAADRHTGERRI